MSPGRQHLNKIPGVDLPASKIELRPAFPLRVLADPAAREILVHAQLVLSAGHNPALVTWRLIQAARIIVELTSRLATVLKTSRTE